MTLAELFSENYEYLNVVAKRITKKKDVSMAGDLISETYLNLSEKGTVVPSNSEEFVKFFSKCMKNYYSWPNSSFNFLYYSNELSIDTDFNKGSSDGQHRRQGVFLSGNDSRKSNRFDELMIDEDALKEIETLAEDTNDFTKELFQISSNMGEEKTLKYIELQEFKRTLPAHELILFELYYEKELSTRKIAQEYSDQDTKMNYQSVNQMINKIKVKINQYQWR